MTDLFRQLPGVDALLAAPTLQRFVHPVRAGAARQVLAELRAGIRAGSLTELPDVIARVEARARVLSTGRLKRVINATGVVLHTNLGRARWSANAQQAALRVMGSCNLELDLHSNLRGGRLEGVRWLMQALLGVEDVLVVNNCASAVLLALTALARDQEVVVSRGELVEIGGSFRVPDVIASGGARLVEVGTTNRTRVADFEAATGPGTAAWLRVHPSNFRLQGFVEAPDPVALAAAAQQQGVVLIEDLGSGCLRGVKGERTVQQALSDGAQIVMFSGDKLLGGPQAGLLVGERAWIQKLRHHPLYRALRVGKVTLAGIEATLADHLAERPVPAAVQLGDPQKPMACRLAEAVGGVLVATEGMAGGGTLPAQVFPGWGVCLEGWTEQDARRLRTHATPVLTRVSAQGVLLDVRCVVETEFRDLVAAVQAVAGMR